MIFATSTRSCRFLYDMTEYVAGYLFSSNHADVLLIRKARPKWQAGKLNAIGGKVEVGETPAAAMIREFREETGLDIYTWEHTLTLQGKDWWVTFFRAFSDDIYRATTMTDEEVVVVPVKEVSSQETIPNLRWMVPMQLDFELVPPSRIVCR
jgi:8-oxo-dGTP diphosphatase